jgi:hypothetical protein
MHGFLKSQALKEEDVRHEFGMRVSPGIDRKYSVKICHHFDTSADDIKA